MHYQLLLAFIPAYFLISITPGINMLTAMNLSSFYGISATMPFIFGALFGVIVITISSISGVTALMMGMPGVFDILKYFAAVYLCYLAFDFLKKHGELSGEKGKVYSDMAQKKQMAKGFLAILNPKGWLFFAALLPAFLTDPFLCTNNS